MEKEYAERWGDQKLGCRVRCYREIPRSLHKKASVGQDKGLGSYYGCHGNTLKVFVFIRKLI